MDTYLPSKTIINLKTFPKKSLNIAVVGSGIAGLSAAWLLSKEHNTTLYEKEPELGGHANTVKINYPTENNKTIPIDVDTGFIVYNNKNYPNLTNFFKYHDVNCADSNMSLSVSLDNGSYEYSGAGLGGIFGQRKNFFKKSQWQLIYDVFKFKKIASRYIAINNNKESVLEEWLIENKFSTSFINNYLIPITSAVWSCSKKDSLSFPTQTFLYFFYHHGLLNIKNRPKWKTVKNGSREYINKVIKNSDFTYKNNVNIQSVESSEKSVYIEINNLKIKYDHVVMACHADQSLNLIKNVSKNVHKILNNFKFSQNKIILHSSSKYMPKNKSLWSSWNYFSKTSNNKYNNLPVQMTYWMNLLQNINGKFPLFITLNSKNNSIEKKYIFKEIFYKHPILDRNALLGQSQLETIQGKGNIWYAGAWTGYGFHEDGITSGLRIAEKLGCKCPWNIETKNVKEDIFTS